MRFFPTGRLVSRASLTVPCDACAWFRCFVARVVEHAVQGEIEVRIDVQLWYAAGTCLPGRLTP